MIAVSMLMHMMLAMLHAVNDAAGGHEEQRLEKSVGNQVKGGGHISADAQRGHHKAQLRDGRIGQNSFDVALRQGHGRRQQRGKGAGHSHKGQRLGEDAVMRVAAGREEGIEPNKREDAG